MYTASNVAVSCNTQHMSLRFYHANYLVVRVDLDYVNVPERYEEGEISKLKTTEGIKIIERFLASTASRERGRQKKGEKQRTEKSYAQKKLSRHGRAGHGVIQVGRQVIDTRRCTQVYMWGRQDGVSEVRVDMNAAALLQQTAPYSPPRFLLASLTTFARLSFHYQSSLRIIIPPLSMVSLSASFAHDRRTHVSEFFFFFSKNALLRSRAKARRSITTQKPRRESKLSV